MSSFSLGLENSRVLERTSDFWLMLGRLVEESDGVGPGVAHECYLFLPFESVLVGLVQSHIFIPGKGIETGTIHELLATCLSFFSKGLGFFLAVQLLVLVCSGMEVRVLCLIVPPSVVI